LFLERRSDNDFLAIERAIGTFFSNLKDVTVLGLENAFSKFVVSTYEDLSFSDYISFISGKVSATMQEHELYSDYKKTFGDDFYATAIALEKEKILYFILTYSQNIVLVKTGQKQEEKDFLGYEFSERRGHEGIKHLPNGTKLFDENGDLLNPQRANSYIYNACLGREVSSDESLVRNVSYGRMSSFISFGTNKFDKVVNLGEKQKVSFVSRNINMAFLGDVSKIEKGQILLPHKRYSVMFLWLPVVFLHPSRITKPIALPILLQLVRPGQTQVL
jgi:type I restriction enzyme M protein